MGPITGVLRRGSIPLAAGLVALGIGCYQLCLSHVLTGVLGWNLGYDDGVYAGVSIRFIHGVLPYRDFVFVAPPGIAYVLAPFSALGTVLGSQTTLILDRCLTVAVVAANPVLAGWLVRPLGRLAMAVSSFSLALWPLAVSVDRGVELEPYLVFFVLLAALVTFGRTDEPSRRRLLLGGALFGFAIVIKAWAVLPAAGAFVVWLPRWRRGGQWLALGLVLGVAVPCAPFLVAAPHAFVHDVISDQLGRQNSLGSTPLAQRLLVISGASALSSFSVAGTVAVVAFVVLAGVAVGLYAVNVRRLSGLEWYIALAAVITFAGMFESALLYEHYAYFPAAMLAPLLGVCAWRIRGVLAQSGKAWVSARRPVAISASVFALGVVAFLVQQNTAYAGMYLSEASPAPQLSSYIPVGACVLSDYPSDLIAGGRFTPTAPGCPAVVDPFGMYLAYDNGQQPHLGPPAYPVAFEYLWLGYLERANYVDLRIPFSDFVPWSQYMITWFNNNYRLVAHLRFVYPTPFIDSHKDIYLYQRIT